MSFFSLFHSLFFPLSCASCGKHGEALCQQCALHLPFAETLNDRRSFALYNYHHPLIARAVRTLKYHRRRELAEALLQHGAPRITEWLAEVLQSEAPERIVLVPIPQHQSKTRERGFSQSLLLARALKKALEGAEVRILLRKYRSTVPQARLKKRKERLANLIGTMEVDKALDPATLYLVVDDVITTGATVQEALRALGAGGAKRILAVALAHGYAQRH